MASPSALLATIATLLAFALPPSAVAATGPLSSPCDGSYPLASRSDRELHARRPGHLVAVPSEVFINNSNDNKDGRRGVDGVELANRDPHARRQSYAPLCPDGERIDLRRLQSCQQGHCWVAALQQCYHNTSNECLSGGVVMVNGNGNGAGMNTNNANNVIPGVNGGGATYIEGVGWVSATTNNVFNDGGVTCPGDVDYSKTCGMSQCYSYQYDECFHITSQECLDPLAGMQPVQTYNDLQPLVLVVNDLPSGKTVTQAAEAVMVRNLKNCLVNNLKSKDNRYTLGLVDVTSPPTGAIVKGFVGGEFVPLFVSTRGGNCRTGKVLDTVRDAADGCLRGKKVCTMCPSPTPVQHILSLLLPLFSSPLVFPKRPDGRDG